MPLREASFRKVGGGKPVGYLGLLTHPAPEELRLHHPRTRRILGFLAPAADMAQAWEALGGGWPKGIALEGV